MTQFTLRELTVSFIININMSSEIPDPERFMEMYGPDALVVTGKEGSKPLTLEQALLREAMLCEANKEVRQDPVRRVRFLARALAAGGSLLPEHAYLIEESE